jgi:hypothetical protein
MITIIYYCSEKYYLKDTKYSNDLSRVLNLKIIPNPISDDNRILCKFEWDEINKFDIRVMDAMGKTVKNFQAVYSIVENGIIINEINSFDEGLYFVNISGNGINLKQKFIVTRN